MCNCTNCLFDFTIVQNIYKCHGLIFVHIYVNYTKQKIFSAAYEIF